MQQATKTMWNGTVRALTLKSSCTPRRSSDALAGDCDVPIDEIVSMLCGSGGFHNVRLEIFSLQFDATSAQAIGEASRRSLARGLHAGVPASGHL